MPLKFIEKVIEAFSKLKGEIDEKRGELDFRHSLANYFLRDVLGWGRKKGEGHYEIRELEDIRLFDSYNRCVALIETKNPKIARLTDKHRTELKEHLGDYKGTAKYGALTNGHELKLFEYTGEGELNELASIDIDAFVGKGAEALSKTESQKVHLLRRLRKDRFVEVSPEYFRKTARTIKIEEPRNFDLFIEDLRGSLDELTRVIYERFFKFYWEACPNHYGGKFLREEAFPRWKGASTGKVEELEEKFCRETAYVILNRILFTRILEDKEIVKRMISSEEFAQSLGMFGEGAYEAALKQAYKNVEKFYAHFYEFSIFDWWRLPEDKLGMLTDDEKRTHKEIEDEFNTVVVRDILKRLNQFDFRKVGRDILGDVYQEYLPPAERKRLGEFYTPIEVVRYILDAVGYTPESRLEDKPLLDPACGSGTFLVEAAKRLAKRYDKKLKYPYQPDNAKVIIKGIINNIHGLDINPFACHIAEMNLLFNIIDYLHAVHSRYRDYRLPRFNICCTDSLMPPEMETAPITEYITNGRIMAYTVEAKRAGEIKRRQFDFVVGNPPYVRKESIPAKYKDVLQKNFSEIYHGDNDLYVYFIGGGIRWLKENGRFGYIVSRKFTKTRYGGAIREYIPNICCIEQYVGFGDTEVFRDVTNYPCILTLKKEADDTKRTGNVIKAVAVKKEKETGKELLEHVKKNVEKKWHSDDFIDLFETKQTSLSKTEWKFIPARAFEVFEKIKENSDSMLKNVSNVYYCIKTGLNEALIVDEKMVNELNLERELLRPILGGEDVKRYRIDYKRKYLVFPYLKEKVRGQVNYRVVDIEKYPNLRQYLVPYKEKLSNRYDIRSSRCKWYELRPCDYYHIFESEKIITPDISSRNNFSYGEGKYYCLDTCFVIALKKEFKERYSKYLIGLLNSKTLEFYFKQISTHVRGMYFRYKREYLEPLPIKLPKTPKESKMANSIMWKVDQILQLNKQSDELEEKINKFPESYYSGEKLVNAAEKCELLKDKYNTKSLKLEPVKKARKELYKLALTKDDYVLFSSRAVAECALEQLKRKNKVRIDEIHGLKVPSEKDASRAMDEFSSDKKRVEETRKEVEKLEGEIDELVYELYGLGAKDREVIEEFLKKF